ncbi:putative 2-aminoethylphosphonate ABC transporter permease subunit [Dongia soli]|uniref:2-aminoethylphosphonate ABC transporter permease subunit n=1 Tax=Dongia soli TaxID=600628 RepID=A0ABU5EAG4_9PROT|nr:putative 2-aminoethylphosphonate ABC transporter permease subunit [Dongia soli]MDY0882861.1 putative 2-aminoethylphosphonate ABC transporter permease subunit [Dongia soli]
MAEMTMTAPRARRAEIAEGKKPPIIRPKASSDDFIMRGCLVLVGVFFMLTVVLPLYALLKKSVEDANGGFVGLANFVAYFQDPALTQSLENTVSMAVISTIVTLALAFGYAYALTRSCMPARGLFKAIALIPLLAPSLLPGLALVYLFGNQGVLKSLLFGESIYGPIGIIIGEVFFAFPHAVMILVTALSTADQRLYEAADALRAKPMKTFFSVTLPGCRYGLISAGFVIFTLVFTDFGVPKVIGGEYNVLATDVYKQVIGQFNFHMGAVVGLMLMLPAVVSFSADRLVQRKQVALLTARAVPLTPKPRSLVDGFSLLLCLMVSVFLLAILGMAAFGSLIKFWPYNLTLTLSKYDFGALGTGGWGDYFNSLRMATLVAVIGTTIVFVNAYMVEKSNGFRWGRNLIHFCAMIPLAVPGVVLGLAYIFFFNAPNNPLNFIYTTMTILVVNTITHYYTVCHLTAMTALKQVDAEFEAVSASLKVPFYKTFWRVTVPVCMPAIVDIGIYYFVNAMTTVSAVIFLYSSETKLMSIAALNTEDAGNTAQACAMGMTIVATSAVLRGIQALVAKRLQRRSQAWRMR